MVNRGNVNAMEDTNNNIDSSAIFGELQTLNQGISSINKQTEELVLYLVNKDKEAEAEKKEAEKLAKKTAEADAEQAEADAEAQEAKDQQAQEQTETYTELLTDIRDGIELENQMFAGQILFMGIICGVLLAKIFFDRFLKL